MQPFTPNFRVALLLLSLLVLLWLPWCASAQPLAVQPNHSAPPPVSDNKPAPPPVSTVPLYRDSWDGWQRHAAAGCVIGGALRLQWPDDPARAFAWALVPGALYELTALIDRPRNYPSARDMASHAVGAGLCVAGAGLLIAHRDGRTWALWHRQF